MTRAPEDRDARLLSRLWLTVPVWILTALAAFGVFAYWSTSYLQVVVVAAALSALVLPLALVAVVGGLLGRRRVLVVVPALVALAAAVSQAPLYVPADASSGTEVTVMTANLRLGRASATDVVAAVQRYGVTVLCVQELTSGERDRLRAAGLYRVLPYPVTQPLPEATGTGLWSRWPLTHKVRSVVPGLSMVRALMSVPGSAVPVTVSAVHLSAPFPENSANWRISIAALRSFLPAPTAGRLLLGGDFNSTYGNRQLRDLFTDGLRDAAEQAGAGWTRTFPSRRWFPPLVAIDHILSRDATARSVRTVTIQGSDHRALVARMLLHARGTQALPATGPQPTTRTTAPDSAGSVTPSAS